MCGGLLQASSPESDLTAGFRALPVGFPAAVGPFGCGAGLISSFSALFELIPPPCELGGVSTECSRFPSRVPLCHMETHFPGVKEAEYPASRSSERAVDQAGFEESRFYLTWGL